MFISRRFGGSDAPLGLKQSELSISALMSHRRSHVLFGLDQQFAEVLAEPPVLRSGARASLGVKLTELHFQLLSLELCFRPPKLHVEICGARSCLAACSIESLNVFLSAEDGLLQRLKLRVKVFGPCIQEDISRVASGS
mmetsp:Transcript_52005/g.91343  ORF Transcript_52005/g.91343 Transcript_52005/m.91343 type:complete len:139 (+) Transcript_52005:46-462(+)